MLLFGVLVIGVLGFKFISGYTWINAIYMTVITITTVGFGEIEPLDQTGKIFTVILILSSVIIVGSAIKIITEYLLSKNDVEELKLKRMQKQINGFKNHIIICGYGRNGKQAARKLEAHNKDFVIVEKDKDTAESLKQQGIPVVYGNANEDEVLLQAGVDRASSLISALPNDADNLFVVLSSRQINKSLHIISRASQEASYSKLKLAGANNVILPDKIGGDHMASLVVVPGLLEFFDNLSIVGTDNVNIEEVAVEKLYDVSQVKTIRDLDLRKKTGCTVIGYKDANGNYTVNPDADINLDVNSKVIVLGQPAQIAKLNKDYNIT